MDLVTALWALAIATAASGELVIRGRRYLSRRALKRTKTTPIAELPQGQLVKIAGVISARDPLLTSPIRNESCVAYSTIVRAGSGADNNGRVALKTAACASFYVTDDSGTAVVRGAAFLVMKRDGAWENAPPDLFPEVTGGERVRCQEILIQVGDRVSVLGRARLEIDPAGRGSFREPPKLNHLTGSERQPVLIGDADELIS
jgi:hypothetical protein